MLLLYIFSYLLAPILLLIIWKTSSPINLILSILLILYIWSRFIETKLLKTTVLDFKSDKIKTKLKIAVLSDLHFGLFGDNFLYNRVKKSVLKYKPDLILVPGDFIYKLRASKIYKIEDFFKVFSPQKIYAVSGNHDYDYGKGYLKKLKLNLKNLVKFIDDQSENLSIRETEICMLGLKDYWHGVVKADLNKKINPKKLNILLAHNPDSLRHVNLDNIDMAICGHTHKGQINIAPFSKMITPTEIYYPNQQFKINKTQVIISAGIGNNILPMRFLSRPEIVFVNYEPNN
jgi:predicted MPP superfamily phosphohydrolase